MANEQNLVSLATRSERERKEIARKGQKASVEARNYLKEQVAILKRLLDEKDKDGNTYGENINLGLIKGAKDGKAENYKTIMEYLQGNSQSNDTPTININIVDNSSLEKAMYDEEN